MKATALVRVGDDGALDCGVNCGEKWEVKDIFLRLG